jgi:hypothetical protein
MSTICQYYHFIVGGMFYKKWEVSGGLSDWWHHLWEYLGRNMPLTTLCIDGWTWCWLAGEPKDQLPILSGGPLFGGGPIIIFEPVKRYILLQLLFLHL